MDVRAIALRLETQARKLRDYAVEMHEDGHKPITVNIGGKECSLNVLSMLDLIDDATLMESDAAKLRQLYKP